jgi:hypothetical protein
MKIIKNKKASIVVLSLILVGFLLIISTWVMRIILTESNDSIWMKNSLKAFYWAESSLELALLKLKIKWFWFNSKLREEEKWESSILVLSWSNFNKKREVLLSYEIDSITNFETWSLESWESDIYQLFYLTWTNDFEENSIIEQKTSWIKLNITEWEEKNVSWSIISRSSWLNWTWSINNSSIWFWKKLNNQKLNFFSTGVTDFLNNNSWSYLIIQNFNTTEKIKYSLEWIGSQKKFTWKFTTIKASWKIGKYKQNIEMKINNSKYLNIIKYVLLSKTN